MKKVLIVAAVLSLIAAPAFAVITGSKHDLNANPYGGSTINEICVYCHTPHGADISITNAPLWNRTTADATSVYGGLDLEVVTTVGEVNLTDAPLCLSCHDGASLTKALNNPPNSGGSIPGSNIVGNANLGTDLNNDHPIGFDYATVAAADAEINSLAAATGVGKIKFFTGKMWCSSCHDVHDNAEAPFLNTTNAGSTLCLGCHAK